MPRRSSTVGITSTLRTTSVTRRPRIRDDGAPDDQRHSRHALVHEQSVRALAVFAQALSVIADEDDEGALAQVAGVEEGQHAADLRIHECDGALIPGRPVGPALGRVVRRVRVVEMQPSEKPRTRRRVQPGQRVIDDLVGRPPHIVEVEVIASSRVEVSRRTRRSRAPGPISRRAHTRPRRRPSESRAPGAPERASARRDRGRRRCRERRVETESGR